MPQRSKGSRDSSVRAITLGRSGQDVTFTLFQDAVRWVNSLCSRVVIVIWDDRMSGVHATFEGRGAQITRLYESTDKSRVNF